MIDDGGSIQLSVCCFDACETIKTAIQGNNTGDLNESVRNALGDFERCVC